jgi:hypothetical protein
MVEPIRVRTAVSRSDDNVDSLGQRHQKFVAILSEQGEHASEAMLNGPKYSYSYGPRQHDGSFAPPIYGDGLFDAKSSPPEFDTLDSTIGGSGTVPTAVGAAINESRKRWGVDPVPSDDLSDDSRKLVDKLEKKGVTTSRTQVFNSVDRESGHRWTEYTKKRFNRGDLKENAYEYSPGEVHQAQTTIRNLLRPNTNKNLNVNQFTQGELF